MREARSSSSSTGAGASSGGNGGHAAGGGSIWRPDEAGAAAAAGAPKQRVVLAYGRECVEAFLEAVYGPLAASVCDCVIGGNVDVCLFVLVCVC
jgi:hypothetical protein